MPWTDFGGKKSSSVLQLIAFNFFGPFIIFHIISDVKNSQSVYIARDTKVFFAFFFHCLPICPNTW
jgi:hypothetical protein